jgi:hypothetical protein
MPVKTSIKRKYRLIKHARTMTANSKPKGLSLTDRIKDPTGIAGSWSDNRSAEEIIAAIHTSRKSKR